MAKLFSKEYHDLSNTWYFRSKLLPIFEGELQHQAVMNEKGNLLIRFFAIPEKKKYFPRELSVVYDYKNQKILAHRCSNCPVNASCNHYLTVINYAYHYLTTPSRREDLITGKKTDQEVHDKSGSGEVLSDSTLKIDNSLQVYTHKILAYNEYWQLVVLNGKILIEGFYDLETDKIRFYFSGYNDIDLREIVSFILFGSQTDSSSKRRKQPGTVQVLSDPVKSGLYKEQVSAFKDSEVALLKLLQTLKCSYSGKYKYYTIYKRDVVKTFPFLKELQPKVLIKETGEQLIFSDDDYQLSLYVERSGKESLRIKVSTGNVYSVFYSGNEDYIFVRNIIYSIQLPFIKSITEKILQGGYIFPERDLPYFASVVAKQTGLNRCYLDFSSDIEIPSHYTAAPVIKLQLSKLNEEISLRSEFIYQEDKILPLKALFFESELVALRNTEGSKEWFYIPYDKRVEMLSFLDCLPQPDRDMMGISSQYIYSSEDKIDRLKKILYERLPSDWLLELDEELKKEFIYRVELKPVVEIEQTDKINWFEYKITYKYQDITFTHEELRKYLKSSDKYTKLNDGRLVYFADTENFHRLDNFLASTTKKGQDTDLLSNYNLSYLYVLSRVNEDIKVRGDEYLEKMYSDLLRRHTEEKVHIPLSLMNVMRSYQKSGFYWLKMLQKYHLGGLLADDMGLGKTLQTLAILSDYYEQPHREKIVSLVVCPKTLLFNWAMEIEKFHPNLTYDIYEGSKQDRTFLLDSMNSDVLIVSYSLVHLDLEFFSKHEYAYVILDEAQHIKNPATLRSKAVKKLQAEQRLALTGTPVENNLIDLWSIFDFLMPGYLPSLRVFRKEFTDEDRDWSRKKQQLSQIVSPFILRRKKSDVLLELPDKQEQYLYNKMTPHQERVYLKILAMAKEKILAVPEDEEKVDYINILTALIRLRQTCNHPGLVDSDLSDKENISGKMELLMEVIRDAVENGRKILVFSQFAMMLKMIARNLDNEELRFEYMDGRTKNRQERVEHFSTNEKVRIFLLTLKVGGLGLNLTAADTVIIVDPWWNPMSENQSIDRVYRIGQTKKVLVYKLITKGTVEEKILLLQQQKHQIFSSVIEGSQSLIRKMSPKDIRDLFEYR